MSIYIYYCFVQASALGGASVLSFITRHLDVISTDNSSDNSYLIRNGKKEVLIIAVEENTSAMKVNAKDLLEIKNYRMGSSSLIHNSNIDDSNSNNIDSTDHSMYSNIVYVRSYAECAGVLAAHKAGILLSSITSSVPRIQVTRL